jgi:hypothetical protein
MTRIVEEFRKDYERVLDRLVDGELPENDRKALLSALDDEPSAWRRCALAFLEAQSLCGHLREMCHKSSTKPAVSETSTPISEAPAKPAPAKPTPARAAVAPPSRFFEICLGTAATLLVAFGLGLWIRGVWNPQNRSSMGDEFVGSSLGPRTTFAGSSTPWHTVNLNMNDPETSEPDNIRLPVVEASNVSPEWLHGQRSAMPEHVRESLERSGHRVSQQQRLWPIQLDDGRRLLVPVEQVDVAPESGPAY